MTRNCGTKESAAFHTQGRQVTEYRPIELHSPPRQDRGSADTLSIKRDTLFRILRFKKNPFDFPEYINRARERQILQNDKNKKTKTNKTAHLPNVFTKCKFLEGSRFCSGLKYVNLILFTVSIISERTIDLFASRRTFACESRVGWYTSRYATHIISRVRRAARVLTRTFTERKRETACVCVCVCVYVNICIMRRLALARTMATHVSPFVVRRCIARAKPFRSRAAASSSLLRFSLLLCDTIAVNPRHTLKTHSLRGARQGHAYPST